MRSNSKSLRAELVEWGLIDKKWARGYAITDKGRNRLAQEKSIDNL